MNNIEIQNLIKELIEKTTIPVREIIVLEGEESPLGGGSGKTKWVAVELNQPHYFIGRDGEALLALNHLVRRMLETKMPKNEVGEVLPENSMGSIMIDINGYQKKRIENIHAVAHMMAERARYFKSSIEIDPMPAFERRIVHEFLSSATDLKTESTGEGYNRRVVIKYIGSI